MPRINLLPWRLERRKQREREFFLHLFSALLVGVFCVMVGSFCMDVRMDNQEQRNAYLHLALVQVDAKIARINQLAKVRAHLLARKKIIERLQANRSQMVHLFAALVRTIPSGARLTALRQNGYVMTLEGVAHSNASVAEYMRNIEASPWMGKVDLSKTENTQSAPRMPYSFGLTVDLNKPKKHQASSVAFRSGAHGDGKL